jgi:hypothetical protein
VWCREIENCLAAKASRFATESASNRDFCGRALQMIWILWALLLIAHGAISRWAPTARSYAKAAVLGDMLLIAVALITIDQLQGLSIEEIVRIGVFFTAFGWAGRQLMGSVLKSPA